MSIVIVDVLGVTCGYGSSTVLSDATLQVSKGEFLGIVGPNGSGKSTLLKAMSRVLPPLHGRILLQEEDIYKMRPARAARHLAVVPQEAGLDFPFTVEAVVMMGRIPHLKRFQREGPQDREIVCEALRRTNTLDLAQRLVTELSGGEKQRVLIARALAQEPQVLFLDEPTSFLDLNYQIEIMELLNKLRFEEGLTAVMVVHDLNLASQYCDNLLVLKEGKIFTAGRPAQVLTEELIKEVYGCEVKVEQRHPGGRPMLFIQPLIHRPNTTHYRVHVVGGGGSCGLLFHYLQEQGWEVSAGVINIGDSDWQEAKRQGFSVVEAAPFSEIGLEEDRLNRQAMLKADYTILPPIPFGSGNLPNLKAVLEMAERGAPVIVIDEGSIAERDYTGGEASQIYKKLLQSQVHLVESAEQAMAVMEREADGVEQ
ncbi:MAG TPA: heme ABC transporter ATP-binding protein [Syntrophomonas sp.]|nr:heme ABC transporter ATP-binding protein [Syntrophomonas sp.]